MNIYLVVSETLYEKVPILDYGEGPLEPYRICELVNAKNKSQATYLAWKKNDKHGYGFRDKPRFRTSVKMKDTEINTPCIVTDFISKISEKFGKDNKMDNWVDDFWNLKNEN